LSASTFPSTALRFFVNLVATEKIFKVLTFRWAELPCACEGFNLLLY